jgi:hypothetical protein
LPDAVSRFDFVIAGVRFALRTRDVCLAVELPPQYGLFSGIGRDAVEGGRYEVLFADPGEPAPADPAVVFRAGDLWRMVEGPGGGLCLDVHERPADRWSRMATVARDFSEGTLHARERSSSGAWMPLRHPHDQILIGNRLAYLGAGLVHGCGVALGNRALLFCGRSGAGKTTIARLWREAGARILNDDRMVVHGADGRAVASATPWHGQEGEIHPETVPLAAIFHLNQAPHNALRRLSPAQSVARLMATSFAPFYLDAAVGLLLESFGRVLGDVPSFELDFTPDVRAVSLCRSELNDRLSA